MFRSSFNVSRGHGQIEREVMEVLRRSSRVTGLDTMTLVGRVYRGITAKQFKQTTGAQEVAVRRALASLARQGLVMSCGENPKHWRALSEQCIPKR
jgi:hypothetical protein